MFTCRGRPKLSSSTADGSPPRAGGLFSSIFTTDELADLTSDQAWIRAMLEAEAALARAEAVVGVIPADAATQIAAFAADGQLDPVALGRVARASGNPVIPLVEEIRAALGEEAGQWAHWGATSQDILDTAAVLVTRSCTTVIRRDLGSLADSCAKLARRHRNTLMIGRSLLQPALPTTFGLKAAGWLSGADAARRQLADAVQDLPLQLGGAVGTLASLGEDGPAVLTAMAQTLQLAEPALPWHTQRQRIAEVAGALTVAAGTAAKITYDIALLMQSEVAEASEPGKPKRGGSSTLPQKRNPVSAATVGGAARRATALAAVIHGVLVQEHERGVGNWHAEWSTLTELLQLSGGAVAGAAECIFGVEVHEHTMTEHLADAGSSLLAERFTLELTRRAGRATAVSVVTQALASTTTDGVDFLDALVGAGAIKWISHDELKELSDPSTYLGSSNIFIDRALAAHEQCLGL